MPPLGDYTIEIEYLLTWYPLRGARHLTGPRIMGGTLIDSGPNPTPHPFVSVRPPTIDAVEEAGLSVNGFVNVDLVPQNRFFLVQVQVDIPNVRRIKNFVVPPNTTVPFMINAFATVDDQFANNTGVTFEGVVTTGHKRGISDVLSEVFVGLARH